MSPLQPSTYMQEAAYDPYASYESSTPYSQYMPSQNTPNIPCQGQVPCPMLSYDPAVARVTGGPDYPAISGFVVFRSVPGGTEVCVDIAGLPAYVPAVGGKQPIGPFGFHIHEKGDCRPGNPANPFEGTGGHWNPTGQPHGNHVGDFPVLFSNAGRARMCFFTNKFRAEDVIGRSVVIHENPDDYRSQPAGNSGRKIACGTITRLG